MCLGTSAFLSSLMEEEHNCSMNPKSQPLALLCCCCTNLSWYKLILLLLSLLSSDGVCKGCLFACVLFLMIFIMKYLSIQKILCLFRMKKNLAFYSRASEHLNK